MEKRKVPRLMIAGISSGSGKTTITCALLAALKKRNKTAASCKCGPDYIDPMFHREVFQMETTNLDLFFSSKEQVKWHLADNAKQAQITIVEGVMGFFDGMGMDTERASSYELSKVTKTPVVLVMNAKGMALTVSAVLKGMLEFREDALIQGVIFNGISKMAGEKLKEQVEQRLPVKVYGTLPFMEGMQLESRHLGLVTPMELSNLKEQLELLGEAAEQNLDIDGLIALADAAEELLIEEVISETEGLFEKERKNDFEASKKNENYFQKSGNKKFNKKYRVGIAKDEAFCFYYKENLALFEQLGLQLVPFSPLRDNTIPSNLSGLYFGGGYPEEFAKILSENSAMRNSVKEALAKDMPCIAECGGFLYLHETMEGSDGIAYPMAGVLPAQAVNKKKLVRFGYIELRAEQENPFLKEGEMLCAHEFHYWDSTENGEMFAAQKPVTKRKYSCMHADGRLLAGFPHMYFPSNPKTLVRFAAFCEEFYAERQEKEVSRCFM